MQILHITTHMGGGAGNAISNMIVNDVEDSHRLICLQCSEKRQYVDRCRQSGSEVWEAPDMETITGQLQWADVIVLHWWHHPLMCGFLANFPAELSVRMILWAHISGCAYPVLQEAFALEFNRIFVTTPFSFENTAWSEAGRRDVRNRADVVYGIGQLDKEAFRLKSHVLKEELVIGYVGTLGKAKLHPEYIDFCQEIIHRIPQCCFLMVGDIEGAEWLLEEIKRRGLEEYFQFTGYCTNVQEQLDRMDVFAYPLNPKHFGTTENVILEAMLAGLPVVLMNQNTEKYIVRSGENGFLVQSKEEYADAVSALYCNPELRMYMGRNARQYVLEHYDIMGNVAVFREGIQKAMTSPKRNLRFGTICGTEPYQWLLFGMDEETRKLFQAGIYTDILKGQSKSSINQFTAFYPEDKQLADWKKLVEG